MIYIPQLLICFLLVTFFCCTNVVENNSSKLTTIVGEESVIPNDTLFFQNDTIIIAQLINDGKAAILKWGVIHKDLYTGKDTLPYSLFGFSKAYKESDYFVIEEGCGTGCTFLYILSFQSNQEGLFLSPLVLDLDKKIIVFQGENMNELATVQNIVSGKQIKIEDEFDKTRRPYSLAIDTAFIDQNNLILKWYSPTQKKVAKKINLEYIL